MVKLYFLTFLFSFFTVVTALSQCVPDSNMTGDYSPPINVGLPDAYVGQNYESAIYIRVPADTVFNNLFTLTVDSLVLEDVTGLPAGLSFSCNTADCKILGGDFGCINLVGFPSDSTQVGDHPLVANFLFYLSGAVNTSVAYSISDYTLTLNAFTGVRPSVAKSLRFEVAPNPASVNSSLNFELPNNESYNLRIYSLLGAEIANVSIKANNGMNGLRLQSYIRQPGIYFASIHQGEYSKTIRFIVQ